MKIQNKDFIEIKFTGRMKDGGVFDSNIKEELEKEKLPVSEDKIKPFVFCVGEGMFIKGVDKFLADKELGKYQIDLKPEDAFGNRNPNLIQTIPLRIFKEYKLNPYPGVLFNFDGRIAKVITVSGGRVMVDFNIPLAGKEVIYEVEVLRKIEDINEKIKSLNDFFFRKEFKFEIKEGKLIMDVEKQMKPFVELFKERFSEIFGLTLEIKEIDDKNKNSKETEQITQSQTA